MILYGELVCGIKMWEKYKVNASYGMYSGTFYNVNQSCIHLNGVKSEFLNIILKVLHRVVPYLQHYS